MENITYRDQILWGTSLSMAAETEIDICYDFVREYVRNRKDIYNKCEQSHPTKNFISIKWECGETANNSDLCDKANSIKKEDLIVEIEKMVSNDISISGEEILKSFEKRKYVDIYKCDRVFFIR